MDSNCGRCKNGCGKSVCVLGHYAGIVHASSEFIFFSNQVSVLTRLDCIHSTHTQIQKLETTWHVLRQKYTDSAFNFEAKLRPTLKCMNDCSNPQAPNTTIPHILPYILLRDRTIDEVLGEFVVRYLSDICKFDY